MPAEVKKEIELGIAHLLFIDIVTYSKLSINEQFRKTEAANRILKIPTRDGMALVFYKGPEEPAC